MITCLHPSALSAQEHCAGARGILPDVGVIWDMRLLPRPTQQRFGEQSLSYGSEQVPGRRRNTQNAHKKNENLGPQRSTVPQVLSSVLCASSKKTRGAAFVLRCHCFVLFERSPLASKVLKANAFSPLQVSQ